MILLCCILIITGIFFADLRIKNAVERMDTDDLHRKKKWKNRILIRKYHNKGAMLNLGQNRSRAVAALSVLLCILITMLFLVSLGRRGNHLLRIGLSVLLGGAFSNTYDRLKRKYVVDYFSFNVAWEPLRWIIFNISDFCIMIGAVLAVLGSP